MGTGSGAGVGTGKGVKGTWRVCTFLLLLTGWQAVLLPWSSLILRDAGFSVTSVGLLSGGTTLVASVGVVMCLRAMRRSRSGAMRRLLLWLLLAGATLLQGCGVVLLLQYIPHTGLLQSCVSGWPFTPTTAAFPLNTSTPSALSLQHPQSLAPKVNTTTTTTTTTSSSIASTFIPSNSSAITTTTSTSTTTPISLPSIPPATTTTTSPTTTTTASATTVPNAAVTRTAEPSHTTVPAVQTTQKTNDKVSMKSNATTVQHLSSGYPEKGKEDYPKETEEEATGTGDAGKVTRLPPGTRGKLKAAYKSKVNSGHKKTHHSYVSPNDSEQDEVDHMTTKNRNKSSHGKDQLTSGEDSDEDISSHDVYEYEDDEEDDDETDETDYEDTPPKKINNYSKSGSKLHLPLRGLQYDARASGAATPWEPHLRQHLNSHETVFQNHPDTNFLFSKNINPNRESASLLNDQVNTRPSLNPRPLPHRQPLLEKARRPHYPARPLHPVLASRADTHVVKDLPDSDWQYYGRDDQARPRHTKYRRDKRSISHADGVDHVPAAKADTNETMPRENKTSDAKWNPLEEVENVGLKAGVVVLLALGGLLGAGVEASVAQLWHCYVHGYDEGGVSQDVLQRTITHTFHLSTYGSHKAWTGITSGGWVMAAGVVSILACLAGAGGNGYGGLLGVHLVLGLSSLLVLLVLPVPYGSIDPPRTRRPLSLYLDDEVLREGVRRLTFHLWVFVNGCLAALSLIFSLWLLQEMTTEGWLVGSQAAAVGVTLVCESLALHTQRRLVYRWGLHGLMGVCGVSLMLHYGVMWASESVGVVVAAHAGLGVAMAFLWVAVKHNALLLATVSDQEREAWASWWCWRFGVGFGAAVWSVGVSGAGGRVRPLLLLAALMAAILASVLCVTAVLSRRYSRTRRRVYHTLDLDMADEEDEIEEDAAENDWLVKRAKKEGLTL